MSWYHWLCPPPKRDPQQDHSYRHRPEWIEERQRLVNDGFVGECGQFWKIKEQRHDRFKWEKILADGSKASARYIEVLQPMPDFLKKVKHISFLQLRSLYLRENGIVSVEAVIALDSPYLSNLDLRQNRIVHIRSLRKAGFCLDHLFLAENPIIDYSPLPQVHFQKRVIHPLPSFSGQNVANLSDLGPLLRTEARSILGHLYFQQINTLDTLRWTALLEK